MSEPIATWNSARGVWETPIQNLLCGHLEPFSQTWPRSGSMRNGSAFLRQRPAPAISAGASLSSHGLLPTPLVTNRAGMQPSPATLEGKRGTDLGPAIGALLPTPRASARENRQTKRTPSQEAGTHGLCLAAEVLELLPTPTTSYSQRKPEDWRAGRPAGNGATRDRIGDLEVAVKDELLPTPRATDGTKWGPGQTSTGGASLPSTVVDLLPTPSAANSHGNHRRSGERAAELLLPGIVQELSAVMRQPSDATNELSGA